MTELSSGTTRRTARGFTTVELLIVIAIIGILATIAALNLRPFSNHAENGANAISAGLKQARARAMATTSAYRLVYASPTELEASYATSCDAGSWTREPTYDIAVEDTAQIELSGDDSSDGWELVACYNSRGFAEASRLITVVDNRDNTRTVEIFVGGGVVIE